MPRERAVARVTLAAIERNAARLRDATGAGVALCAVVKGAGYGHGAVPSARAALAGGATWLPAATPPGGRRGAVARRRARPRGGRAARRRPGRAAARPRCAHGRRARDGARRAGRGRRLARGLQRGGTPGG